MIHDKWGFNEAICNTADEFAKNGFCVLVPDVYRANTAKTY